MIRTLHSLNHDILMVDGPHKRGSFCWSVPDSTIVTNEIYIYSEVTLPFVCHPSRAKGPIDD